MFVYLADTLRADHIEPYGYVRGTTPRLARLAEQSVVFERCVAQGNWTKSSLPSFMTSTYVATHGVPRHRGKITDDLATLAEALRAEGYRTASFLTNRIAGHDSGLARGFSVVFDHTRVPRERRDWSRSLPDAVLPWIRAHAGEPLFVYVHTAEPHDPYEPPQELRPSTGYDGPVDGENFVELARSEEEIAHVVSLYDGEIAYMDRSLGTLLDGLDELDLFADSCFVFTSDHGEAFREHGEFKHGAGLYHHQIDVPLIVHRPGGVGAGARRTDLVQSIDVMPTLLVTAGATIPGTVEGRDLFGREAGARDPSVFPWTGTVSEASPLSAVEDALEWAYRDDDWKVILGSDRRGEAIEVYDLRSDPLERSPVSAPFDPRVERVLEELRHWRELSARRTSRGEVDGEIRDLGALEELEALGYTGDD